MRLLDRKIWRKATAVTVIGLLALVGNARALQPCIGDCDNSGDVTIDELIRGVDIALGILQLSSCPSFSANGDAEVTIDELLQAVNAALDGCEPLAATPTPSATPPPTPTATAAPTFVPGTCDDPAIQASEPLCALDHQTTNCDFLIEERCLLPFPSSVFLATDPTTDTGFRINYSSDAMPANSRGMHVNPTEWNTLDGFSPGTEILALFPGGVDLAASGAPSIANIERSLEADSPTVLINAATGEHILHFAEMDAQAMHDATRALIIRPGVRLQEATRYIVAIRGLKDLSGQPIAARRAFQIVRDGVSTPVRTIEARRPLFEDIFSSLGEAGVGRDDLILAWDFVTASSRSLTSRALSVRDQGLAFNGPGAPAFTITSVEDNYSDDIFRRVRGTYTVPLFMTSANPPARYNLDANGVPAQNGTTTAPFTITIPRIAVGGAAPQPGRPVVYGHGLLGSGEGEVTAGNLQTLSNKYNFILGATDWIGLSENDMNNTVRIIADFSNFPQLTDRLQQAMLNFILLGRLMTAPDGLLSNDAFKFNGVPIIDPQELYYYGLSQGGIEGGAYLALSPDTHRGVLGVGAANYSTLLQRSIDFGTFNFVFVQNYLDELDRAIVFPLIQQLWDRGEPNGYTSHLIADPLPGTPAKKVLMQTGLHDSQVSNLATIIQVRSLGIPAVSPPAISPFGIPTMDPPFDGSAWVPYEVGGTPEPQTNTAPAEDNNVHEAVRRLDQAQAQIDAFLRPDGTVQNFCVDPNTSAPGACIFTNVPNVH